MSLRSCVNESKAASMAALSVLPSTTRKFFWLSGGGVTCWRGMSDQIESWSDVEGRRRAAKEDLGNSYTNAGEEKSSDRVLFACR